MLPKIVVTRPICVECDDLLDRWSLVGHQVVDEIEEHARVLGGVRVCHINATASGGGVAELLHRQIPLYRSVGVHADWRVIHGDKEFFTITKGFHNALQGGDLRVTSSIAEEYLDHNRISAEMLEDEYDLFVVHDPQPAAIRHFKRNGKAKWIWRCHIDTSEPNPEVWQFLRPYIQEHDLSVFTMETFRPPDLQMEHVAFISPAIDPFSTKNMELPHDLCRRVVADHGFDLRQPILLQVSRFDPWKDPLGVIQAYRLVKEKRPGVQLAMVGAMAGDDPEGWAILEAMNAEATKDPHIHILTNLTGVGNMEVNAFQRGVDIVIQKSLREGFGLVVSEAFWKEKPVVAGAVGGIPMQFPGGYHDYLVRTVDECAEKVLFLLDNPDVAAEFGRAGKEKIRQQFLLPRLIRDELRLMRQVLG